MPHIIILSSIEELQGENITGTGIFNELLGYMETVETIEEKPIIERTEAEADVLIQAATIAEMFENGFTSGNLAVETTTLGTLIGSL
jgi:hypothetical protein